jgi:hypothetical protein
VAVAGLAGQQAAEHAQAVPQEVAVAELLARRDDGLGDGRVRVAEPGCRPRPRRIGGRLADDRAGDGEQRQRARMAGPSPEYLGGTERRERYLLGSDGEAGVRTFIGTIPANLLLPYPCSILLREKSSG